MLNYSAEKNVQRLIFSLKYYGNRKLAFTMGRLMAIRSRTECSEADFLLPVPLHRRRERRRGYNQAEWLCRGMSSVWGTPVATHALRRRIATGSQAHKSHAERRAIMQNNVFVTNRIDNLAGKKLLLVDDVITTGSTLTACAMPLLNIPEVRLCVLTLAAAAV
jgi:ComF family protein